MRENMFLETADRIGRRLCRDAVWAGNTCNWLGWALEVVGPTWTPVYKAQNSTIYDGTAGIGLFLARLYQFTRDAQQRTPPQPAPLVHSTNLLSGRATDRRGATSFLARRGLAEHEPPRHDQTPRPGRACHAVAGGLR